MIASLNFTVIEKRMMSATEAADYCGLAAKHFKASCPVSPVELAGKVLRYDKRDLDQWIDGEKATGTDTSRAGILARL